MNFVLSKRDLGGLKIQNLDEVHVISTSHLFLCRQADQPREANSPAFPFTTATCPGKQNSTFPFTTATYPGN
jgi:hypothetical protein